MAPPTVLEAQRGMGGQANLSSAFRKMWKWGEKRERAREESLQAMSPGPAEEESSMDCAP